MAGVTAQGTVRVIVAVVERKQRSVRGVRSGERGGQVKISTPPICFRGNSPIKKTPKIYCDNPEVLHLAGIECP